VSRSLTSLRLQFFGLLLMSLAVIGFTSYWLIVDIHRSDEAGRGRHAARQTAAGISALVRQQRDFVRLKAAEVSVSNILTRNQPQQRTRLEEDLRAGIPNAISVRVLPRHGPIDGDALDPESLKFLNQALGAKQSAISAFHELGTESEHFDIFHPVTRNETLLGHLLVSISTAPLKELLNGADPSDYVELRRSSAGESQPVMSVFGNSQLVQSWEPALIALDDVQWTVAYWVDQERLDLLRGNRIMLFILLALATMTAIGTSLILHATISHNVTHDIKTLVRMFRDVREGSVRATYPMTLKEFTEAYGYLREYGKKIIEEQQKLMGMGLIDHLSQLSNRRHFEARLKKLFKLTPMLGPSTVLIIDVDQFKHVNDTYGHDAGDALIVEFSKQLRKSVRQSDFLARLGGDEFCVIYPHTSLEAAILFVERLRKQLPRTVELKKGIVHNLRWTGGLSVTLKTDKKFDEVLWRADQALIKGKEAGRNVTIIYDSTGSLTKQSRVI
jgi:diguanylate cyclase (GGDEF)-like protein